MPRTSGLLWALLLLCAVAVIISPAFLNPFNLINVLRQVALFGIVSIGMTFVILDRKVNTNVTLHIGADNKLIGEAAAHFIGKTLGGQGNVIEIQGMAGASATVDRHEVFRAVLAEHYPGVKVIADQVCNYTREPALKFMEDMVQRFGPGEIQVVYAHNDEMALGAATALEAAGRLGEVMVVGIDGQEIAYEAIKHGKMAATFTYHFVAPEGVQYAYKIAKGEMFPQEIVPDTKRVDGSNIDQFLGTGF